MAEKRKKITRQKPPVQPRKAHEKFDPTVPIWVQRMIGRVIVAWARLESGMHDTIWRFLDISLDEGRALTGRQGAEALIASLRLLARSHLPADGYRELSETLDLIEIYKEDRNSIAHGMWETFGPDAVPIAMLLRAKSAVENEVTSETFPRDRFYQLVDGILEATQALRMVQDWLDASRDRSSPPPATGATTDDADSGGSVA